MMHLDKLTDNVQTICSLLNEKKKKLFNKKLRGKRF